MISRIGKYTVEAELGRGGFGQVYKAWDPDVHQAVAIKVLLAEGDPDLLKRFQLEVVTTASLHHKNIVTIYASGEEGGIPYLVMELLEGQTLSQIIKQRIALSLMEKVRIMTQVAEGLAYAHSRGVVHRDVKPANIMLLPDGSAKIMDFGIALAASRRSVSVTMHGFVVGTAPYMSPEQFTSDSKASEQTDIFSFGSVYYELLAGKHPFEPFLKDFNALRVAILMHDPPPLSQLVPECPEALELLVHRSLAKDREFRYQTFEELRLDSEAVLVDLLHDQAAAILQEVPPLVDIGDMQGARVKVREAQKLEPGNRQARQLLETIDQKLQEKLNRDRIATRLKEAEQHLSERRFAEGVHILEAAARIDSSNVLVQARLSEAKAKLEGALQANRLLEDARARQQHGELPEALDRLNRALEIDPEHTEARRLSAKVNEQLLRRQREQIRQKAMQAASEHSAGKRYTEALAALDELEKEQPGGPGVSELRREIERDRAKEERRMRGERLNLAFAKTSEALQAGELERAGQMLAHLNMNFASDPGAAEALPLLRERLDALLRAREIEAIRQRADALLKQKGFQEATDLLAEAAHRYPDDQGLAREKASANALREAHKRSEDIANVLRQANSLRDEGNLHGALAAIADGRRRLGDEAAFASLAQELDMELERQRHAAGLKDVVETVRKLMAAGKYAEAVDRITRAGEYGREAEVLALLDSARAAAIREEEQEVVSRALSAAANLETRQEREKAASTLEGALRRVPHNVPLSQALDRLRDDIERERRRASIEEHRATIQREAEAAAWEKAEAAVRQAQAEFPGEKAFFELAERVDAGLRSQAFEQAASHIRAKLAANDLVEATQQLEETRTAFVRDPRWKALEEEVALRRGYEAALEQAERQRREGNLAKAEALLTGVIADAPDPRATQMFGVIQSQRAEAAAAGDRVRQCLERADIQQATAELNSARARYPDQNLWSGLQSEIDARRDLLRGQNEIVDSVLESLHRDDIQRAASKLAEGRAKFQNDTLWANLQAEIDARQSFLKRQADIAAAAASVRNCLESGDLTQAADRLRLARESYPDQSVWAALQTEIEARRAEIAAVAERVRDCVKRDDFEQAAVELSAARTKYPRESLWAALEAEMDARRAQVLREAQMAAISETVRGFLDRHEVEQAAAALAAALSRYPGEGLWPALQVEIDRCQAQIAAVAEAVRDHLRRDQIELAAAELAAARQKAPTQSLWTTLHAEIEAARERRQRSEAARIVVEQAQELLRAGRIEDAIGVLRNASHSPDTPQIAGLLTECESRLRQRELQEIESRAEALLTEGKPQEAAALIATRSGAEPLLQDLLARVRRELDRQRCRTQLLSIEQEIGAEPPKRRLKQVDREAKRIAAPYPADEEISAIAGGIHARVKLALASSSPRKPLPRKLIGACAAAFLVVAGALLLPRLLHKSTASVAKIPIEIVTNPPGAIVRLGDRYCETPTCRLDLAPGSYVVEAELKDYVPKRQTVVVDASNHLVELTLQPLPPAPPKPGQPVAATGTLVVQAGVPDALVYVDGVARNRTDQSGSLTLRLEAQAHEVRVERNGYEKLAPRQVRIAGSSRQTVVFPLRLQSAMLELGGAPAGVEVRAGGEPLGRTDGSAIFLFRAPVAPGDQPLQVALGSASRAIQQRFGPGQTVHLEWKDVAPAVPVSSPPAPEPPEAQAWARVRTSSDSASLQAFLRNYPNGPHAKEAESRRADLVWGAVDRTNVAAVREFLTDNPDSPHRLDGQRIVDQFDEHTKQEQAKQETLRQDAAKQQDLAQQDQLRRQQVLEAVRQLDSALQHRRARDVKAIWPSASRFVLDSLGMPGLKLSLSATEADVRFSQPPDRATVEGNLVRNISGATTRQKATLTLRNSGGAWIVESARFD